MSCCSSFYSVDDDKYYASEDPAEHVAKIVLSTYDGKETKYTDSTGIKHTIRTARQFQETDQDLCDRHDSRVDAVKATYP